MHMGRRTGDRPGRRFILAWAGGVLGAAALACAGVSVPVVNGLVPTATPFVLPSPTPNGPTPTPEIFQPGQAIPDGAAARIGDGDIRDSDLSADGKFFAVATSVSAIVYDAQKLTELWRWRWDGHPGPSAVSFSSDSSRVAVGYPDGRLLILRARNGKIVESIGSYSTPITHLAWSADSIYLAVAAENQREEQGFLDVWNIAEKRLTRQLAATPVTAIGWSSKDPYLAARIDTTQLVWDATTGVLINSIDDNDRLRGISWFPGKNALAITEKGDVEFRDVKTNKFWEVIDTSEGMDDTIIAVATSPDGGWLAESSAQGRLWLWNLKERSKPAISRSLSAQIGTPEHAGIFPGSEIFWSADGDTLFLVPSQGNSLGMPILAWRRSTDTVQTLPYRWMKIISGTLSPHGSLAVANLGNHATVVDVLTGEERFDLGWHKGVATWSPDGTMVALGDYENQTLTVWDAASGLQLWQRPFSVQRDLFFLPYSMAWSSDGTRIAAEQDSAINLFAAQTGSLITKIKVENNMTAILSLSPDGRLIEFRTYIDTDHVPLTEVYDAQTGSKIDAPDLIPGLWLSAEKVMALSKSKQNWQVYDLASGQSINLAFPVHDPPAFASVPDHTMFITSEQYWVKLWDLKTGAQLSTIKQKGLSNVWQWSPDGQRALMATNDDFAPSGAAILDLKSSTITPLQTIKTKHQVKYASWLPDGTILLVSSDDGTVITWRLAAPSPH